MTGKKFLCINYSVLVVDNTPAGRKDICSMLYSYGVSTDEADSPRMAEKLAGEHEYDMILVRDRVLSEEGIGAAGRILNSIGKKGAAPFMIAIAESSGDNEHFLQNGFCDVIGVPFDEDTIHMTLDQWIPESRKRYLDELDTDNKLTDIKSVQLFMSGVDVVSAIKNNGGIEDYLDLLDVFYIDGQTRYDSLSDKIDKQDFNNYTIEVHGLKSAAANIGAAGLSAIAKQHEMAGNASDFDYIRNNREELFDCYGKILSEIKRVLEQIGYGQFAKPEAGGQPALSKDELLEKIKFALERLEAFRSKEAAAEVDELLNHALEPHIQKQLEEIQVLLRVYEDDEAEEKLRNLISNI